MNRAHGAVASNSYLGFGIVEIRLVDEGLFEEGERPLNILGVKRVKDEESLTTY